jgi:glycolate oxidase iron-sulfur subunit
MTTITDKVRSPLSVIDKDSPGAGIDYELFLDCVHCGLCTASCPTYVELGTEADSPRGRIYLMRAVTDGRLELNAEVRRHLDLCLDCRGCESACPSGVQYGRLIEPFRIQMNRGKSASQKLSWSQRLLLFHVTPYARRVRWALAPAKMLQWSGLDAFFRRTGLLGWLPRSLRQLHEMLPPLERHYGRLPEFLPAHGPRRARVAFFTGCAADAFFPQTNFATAAVLQHNGCDVWIPRGQVCCGALHYHAAEEQAAKKLAETNVAVFAANSVDALVVNAAGCGAMLKDYGHLLDDGATAKLSKSFAGKVKDVSEFLMELGPIRPEHPLRLRAAYHDACHLCHAQRIRKQPRDLLSMIPGLELVPLAEPELCCGAAGSYNLTEPEMAERLGRRKADHVLHANVQAVFAGNVGCLLQIGRYLRERRPDLWVAHPIDALWASYTGTLSAAARALQGAKA